MEVNEKDVKKRDVVLKWLPAVFTIIAGTFTLINYVFFDMTYKELANTKLKMENELRPREFENNLRLTLYKEVKEAIGQKDTLMQNAALLVVNEMLDTDSSFREKLINILLLSTNSQKLKETQQKLDEFQEGQVTIEPDQYTIDVFYLEDIEHEAEPRADAVCSVLQAKYPNYTVRKRLLPKSVNTRIGYQIDFNQIRYDTGTEEERLANDILKEITKHNIFQNELPALKGIKSNRKNYLSIYIRNM